MLGQYEFFCGISALNNLDCYFKNNGPIKLLSTEENSTVCLNSFSNGVSRNKAHYVTLQRQKKAQLEFNSANALTNLSFILFY